MANMISITDENGQERFLGNIEPEAGLMKSWTVFGDTPETPVIPETEWDRYCSPGFDDPFWHRLHDQNGVGQCCPEAASGATEDCLRMQGLIPPDLSAADLYDRINRGSDNGSLLEDAMHELMTNGVGTVATCGTLWKRGQFRGPASSAERVKYGVTEVFLCPEFQHCFSAVAAGFRLISGIMWYPNDNVDQDGWLPATGTGRPGGHAIKGFKPVARSVGGRKQYGIAHHQSWGPWGYQKRGIFVIPQSRYAGPVGGWFAIRQVTDAGGVIPTPK